MITTQQTAHRKNNTEHTQSELQSAGKAFANAKPKSSPSVAEMNQLASLFNQGQQEASLHLALEMTEKYALHGFGWKVLGALYQQQGSKDQALDAFKKAATYLPKDAEVHFNLANVFCDFSEFKPAVSSYKKAIKLNPMFTQAHYNLGLAYQELNQLKDAEASFKIALKQSPKNALMHSNLGVLMKDQKRYPEADAYFMQALAINPDLVEVHYQLGVSFAAQERFEEAEQSFLKTLALNGNFFEAYSLLSVIYQHYQNSDMAEACLRKALGIKPDEAITHFQLANLLKSIGKLEEAEASHKTAISIKSDFHESYNNLGMLYLDKGDAEHAAPYFRKALEIKPDYLESLNNLALSLSSLGRKEESEQVYKNALEIAPDSSFILTNLSVLLISLGRTLEAQDCLDKSLSNDSQYIATYLNMVVNYLDQGKIKEAYEIGIQGLEKKPDQVILFSNVLFAMTYSSEFTPAAYLAKAIEFGQVVTHKVTNKYSAWRCSSQPKRLRVGIVSGDLHQHAVSYFLENVIRNIDPSQIELIAYSSGSHADSTTERLKYYFSEWHSIVGVADYKAAQQIHDNGIHILIDLSGHSGDNRLSLFAWKPAAVQVSWLGYWATTGVAEIDYVLTDEMSAPPAHQTQFSEKFKYLPNTRMCFTAPKQAVGVSPVPACNNGYITFGSFQNMAKVNDEVLALWAKVLTSVAGSRFRWQCKSFAEDSFKRSVKQRLVHLGVKAESIQLLSFSSREGYFAAHQEIDILLDTFPFTGGTTTCEAMWLGVPTLTLAGESMIARQGASLLAAAGLQDWIANTKEEYLSKAIAFSADLEKLSLLRTTLRQQVLASPIFDSQTFARNFEKSLWEMWTEISKSYADVELTFNQHNHAQNASEADSKEQTSIISALPETFQQKNHFEATVDICLKTLVDLPNSATIYNNLAGALREIGRLPEAIEAYRKSIALDTNCTDTLINLAQVLVLQDHYADAEVCVMQALALAPNMVEAYNTLGVIKQFQGDLPAAQEALVQAIELSPENADFFSNLASVLLDQGQITVAESCFNKAFALAPTQLTLLRNVLFCTNYLTQDGIAYLTLAKEWGSLARQQAPIHFDTWQKDEEVTRLKVGFVSGDLREHPVAFFLESMLTNIDPSRIELYAYATDYREDHTTARIKPYFSQWKTLRGLSDLEAAQLIHQDGIHILIDLSGHTGGSRLPMFACKPAPVQASWLGYYASTGLNEMDYFLADEISVPTTQQHLFTEKLRYLPHSRLCFTPPSINLEVTPLPAITNGFITFGSFQNMAKVNDDVLILWAKILQTIPNARLRWQCKSFTNSGFVDTVKTRLTAIGFDLARVTLLPSVAREAYLSGHAEVDVILDTFTFTGGTTTCEALWMGVPTLTMQGNTLVSRQGASLLTAAGLADWVVDNETDYLNKALAISQNTKQLAKLRSTLREQVQASPLLDGASFAQSMESLLWEMWREHLGVSEHAYHSADQKLAQIPQKTMKQTTDQQPALAVEIVSATRMSEHDFWDKSALGLSLKRLLVKDARLTAKISYENTRGLSEIFNKSITQSDDSAVLVFIHDDVWIDEANFAEVVMAGLDAFDVIGVAGNKRRVPYQPAWAFIDTKFTWDDDENLSGRVGHGNDAFGETSDYGAVPAECLLLDGVFLAARKSTLTSANVQFDTQFDFHFYDLDFCRTATDAGLKLGTWPVRLTHQSGGAFGTQGWREKYLQYLNKWEEPSTPTLSEESRQKQEEMHQAIQDVMALALDSVQQGQLQTAESLYLEILQIQPLNAAANYHLGLIDAHNQKFEMAAERLEKAANNAPEIEQYWISYIDALILTEQLDQAISTIEIGQQNGLRFETATLLIDEIKMKKTTHNPNQTRTGVNMNALALSTDEMVNLALASEKAGKIDEAVEHYLQILSEDPQHALANHNLGVIEAHTKSANVALPRLENAVMSDPASEQFWVSYIDALMQSGGLEQVLQALELGQQHGLSQEMANVLATEFMEAHDADQAIRNMKQSKQAIAGYTYHSEDNYYHPNSQEAFAYKDAGDSESRIYQIIRNAKDKNMFSGDITNHANDWPSYYHLTPLRANILRPFANQIANGSTLELGAGCGAVTRFIGELGGRVVALEGSPNRARIIGNRCSDLDNVTIISDLIQNFKTNEKFDVVTLIGVLEYAQVYVDSPDPIRHLLKVAKSFLKPDGVLVIAIENQLGLKYFCGSPEDHLGSPMFGINDSYTTSSPITFGRKELTQHIQSVGFEHIDLYIPLPDYKTPVTIVYPEGFSDESIQAGWNVSPLLSGSAVFDWQSPRAPVFSMEAAWSVIGRNGLGQDLANSFLFAARVKAPVEKENILAAHYGCQRPAKFSKETQFLINEGTLTTQTRMVGNTPSLASESWQLGIYRSGKLWYDQLLVLMNRPEWSHAELCQWTKVWVQALRDTPFQKPSATIPELQHFAELLPAHFVDATPTNLVVNHDGKGEFFDLEWNFSIALPIEFVVFRGLFLTIHRVTSCARPAKDVPTKIIELVISVMKKIGMNVTADEMELFFALFNTFQNRTQGIDSNARNGMMDILENANLPIRKLFT